ncbi:hypothetical protein HPB47_016191 [Ixodes persulcatus]|uniref:Uncharacterized protein n=1 Tax=Ixodes persulcatus TaxID=34615 RepID=A0AC60QRI0_IXOPE|nr:hypothetical protein HPB47_016191 [Ixodes persulcatus]
MECEATLHLDQVDLTLAEPAKQYSNDDDGNSNPWITVLPRHFKNRSYDTVIIKITDGLNLKESSHQKIGQAITLAAQFTPGERLETFFKVREGPNLIAADTYRPSAKSKLLRLTSINIDGVNRPTSTYLAMGRDQVRGVVHGLDNLDDASLQNSIQSHDRTILSAHRMGRSNTVLLTFAGLHLPRYITVDRVVTKIYPYRPRSILCLCCQKIGHKAEVCPKEKTSITCQQCSQEFPLGFELAEDHQCIPYCHNCGDEHSPAYPQCPARLNADIDQRRTPC